MHGERVKNQNARWNSEESKFTVKQWRIKMEGETVKITNCWQILQIFKKKQK